MGHETKNPILKVLWSVDCGLWTNSKELNNH